MDLGLSGKVAVVTGGSKGIGRAISEMLAAEGAKLVICARGIADTEAAAAAIRAAGGAAEAIAYDAASAESADALVKHVRDRHGAIDILVNNAGGMTSSGFFNDTPDQDWRDTYEINVLSAVRLVRGFRPLMANRGQGRVINISSENGVAPERAYPHYGVAKAALIALTKTLSKELGREAITVNCVSPGIVETEGTRAGWEEGAAQHGISYEAMQQRFMKIRRPNVVRGAPGLPEEIAGLVAFLCSPLAAYITGVNYRVDGGQVAVC
ncbi:MAG: SDR family NAD(P)-dependent oxidoreductase [Sphingomonadaceae bacterium]|nr:SDR family NAD(P)-dependent oxidoreductase [Sphingomonadaceae bacterium]